MRNWTIEKFPEMERKRIVQAAKITLRKPEGKKALNYLKNIRKFSDEIIEKFDIGYCPFDLDHELRGRLITPIYDTYGELVVLSTRHLDKNAKNRFLHETFDKGSYLYGLCYAKETIYKNNKVIIVEGEFDVASFHSYGFMMTVGLCGSAFTLFQVSLLARYCNEFYLLFDGDAAGKKSIERAMKMYRRYKLDSYKLKFIPVFLPKGVDPDDYIIAKGKKETKDKLINARENCNII